MKTKYQTHLDSTVVLTSALMFLFVVSHQGLPSGVFYLLCMLSLVVWGANRKNSQNDSTVYSNQYKILFILCSVNLLAVLVSKIAHHHLSGSEIEKAARFSVGLPLLMLGMKYIPVEKLKHCLWGVYAAVLYAFAYVVYLAWPDFVRPDTSDVYNAVGYGVITLLLSSITLYSIGVPLTSKPRLEKNAKILIGLLGMAGFMVTQTRTGLLVLPVYLLLGILLAWKDKSRVKIVIGYLVSITIIFALLFTIPMVQNRVEEAKNEFLQCIHVNPIADESICIRLQLWNTAIDIWQRNPLIGTGSNAQFSKELQNHSVPKGMASQTTANDFGEPHNDYLQALSSFGPLGVLGLLFLYFAPAWIFVRRLLQSNQVLIRSFAAMGAAVCLGFAMYSMTELMFRGMRTLSFYTFMVAVFLLLSAARKDSQVSGKQA
ncbi:O-antigen ligase family protein [Advenella alkanexedens]|uniref:O-antigen ligase family protein n=1 Tax=Advenella alkanexedens TaxID=1481665 RepID=A0ABS6NKT5_9BURK|nr:O-antigen ligase family protein [Advenella alkanexedens]MBV4396237.1 O-antigen ligase family protein [Advenella alkanexedens]